MVHIIRINVPVFLAQQLLCLSKTDGNFMGNCVKLLTENSVENIYRAGVEIFLKKSRTHIKILDARNVTSKLLSKHPLTCDVHLPHAASSR
jgi:hypothetical protein